MGAGEPMVMIIIEIADRERGCAVVDFPEEIVSAEDENSPMPVYGPSRPDASAPAIREVNDNVLVDGGVFVVEFACVDGHGKLWAQVQMIESDVPDGKARLRGRT